MIHEAGPLDAVGLQICVRCGVILTDYRGAMVPDGSGPLGGWETGAAIDVYEGNPRMLSLTEDPPDCERVL